MTLQYFKITKNGWIPRIESMCYVTIVLKNGLITLGESVRNGKMVYKDHEAFKNYKEYKKYLYSLGFTEIKLPVWLDFIAGVAIPAKECRTFFTTSVKERRRLV